MRLTDISIRNLPCPLKGQKTYTDATVPGFGCRVSQGGTRSFVVQYGVNRQLVTIGRYPIISLADARTEAKRILAEKVLGKHRPEAIRYDAALKLFLLAVQQKNKPRTYADYTRVLNKHFNFGKTRLADISSADINRKLDRLVLTPSEHGHALNTIKIFFNWALRKRYVDHSPCRGMQAAKGRARSRVLTDAELAAVWKTAVQTGYPFGDICRLLILTGARRGEIAHLQWSYVNGDTITLPPAIVKNNREHTFPIGAMAREILDGLPSTESPYLFPAARGERVFKGWAKCKARLDTLSGVHDWVLHDLRRTMSTKMAEMGIAPHVIERLINHVSGGTLSPIAAVYNRATYMPEMRHAVTAWEKRIVGILCA
jgi:integrase